MQRILHRTFDGLVPRLEPSMLGEHAAQIAQDVDLRRGVLTPVLGRAPDTIEGHDALVTGATRAYLRRYFDYTVTCGTAGSSTASTWAALAATGRFKVTVNSVVYECHPTLTGCTTMRQVADALQGSIADQAIGVDVLVLWDATAHKFTLQALVSVSTVAAPTSGTNLASSSWMNGPGTTTTPGEQWLSWADYVNVVQGPVNDDPYSRIYYTGDGVPKMRLRIAGVDVARDLKIEQPATAPDASSEAPYTAPADVDARAAFEITEARWQGYEGGPNGIPRMSYPVGFQKVGDTVLMASGGLNVGTLYMALEFKVNGKWEDGFAEGNGYWHIDILDSTAAYKMQFDFDGGGTFRWVRTSGGYLTWSGSIKLVYTGGTQVPDDSVAVTYCCSYVTDIGEEGPISAASEVYLAEPDTDIVLDSLPQPTGGTGNTRGIIYVRLYRAAGGVFKWLADIPVGTTTYTDTTPDDDTVLGESANDDTTNPPDDMQGLIACAGGWFAAFRGREFMASEAFIPTSWPEAYRLTVQNPIVALAATGNDTFVMTQGRPVMMSGSDPAALTAVNIECDQACVSAAGVALLGQMVLYPSPDGIVAMYAGAAKIVTAEWYRREDWQALVPESIQAVSHDGRYYALLAGLNPVSLLVMDFSESVDRVTLAEAANITGLYADLLDDTLYVIENEEINVWRGGAEALQFDWRGRDWLYPQPVSFGVLRVLATAYVLPEVPEEGPPPLDTRPLVTLYANGAEVLTHRVTSAKAVRLPRLQPARRWSLRIQSAVEVSEVNLATGMEALLR